MLASMQRRPGLDAEDTMLAITTLAFDIAVLEIFLPLACGARVVIAAGETVGDGVALTGLIERSGVSVMQATPATLRMLLDAGWAGAPRLNVLCGGEAWTAELASQLLPRCGSLWNMYGPTETTVWSAVTKVEAGRPIVIGPPIANTRFYVLDGAFQLVPVGVPGELHIGGDGLARGYLHRPQLTRERFVTDPFATGAGCANVSYRRPGATSARWHARISRPSGSSGEDSRPPDRAGGNRIGAGGSSRGAGGGGRWRGRTPTATSASSPTSSADAGCRRLVQELRACCWARRCRTTWFLRPSFPGRFFPLTPSGKLDRKALPPPDVAVRETDAALPCSPALHTEKVLARIWCEMLDLEQVGVRDNFFDLGGHSLLAVRVIGEINKTLKARLNVPAFFQNPTIERLARVLEQKDHVRPEPHGWLPLQPGHTGLPLYFVGAGPHEYRLAQLIGEDRAIFAIDVPMPVEWRHAITAADPAAPPTIEQLGALYGDVLRAHAGSSPCVVAGYSFVGKIAFEAARALQRAGGNVALVLLLDARAYTWSGFTRGPAWQSLRSIWRGAATKTANDPPYIDRLSASLAQFLAFASVAARADSSHGEEPPSLESPSPEPLSGSFDKNGMPIDSEAIDSVYSHRREVMAPAPARCIGRAISREYLARRCCLATILPMDGATSSLGAWRSSKRQEIMSR